MNSAPTGRENGIFVSRIPAKLQQQQRGASQPSQACAFKVQNTSFCNVCFLIYFDFTSNHERLRRRRC